MEPIKVLVVEDELVIALNITNYLEKLGYKVVKCVSTFERAVKYLSEEKPDIAILDIKINGNKSGIDIATYITESIKIPFIFLTSVSDPRTFKQAKILNPSAYLLKPFSSDDLYTSIELAVHNYYNDDSTNDTSELADDSSFIIKSKSVYYRVAFKDILYAKSDHVYMELYTIDGKKHLIRSSINSLIKKLPNCFIQVHRSYIVNEKFIKEESNQTLMVNGTKIPISRSFKR
jgi:two-component system, LytTR family, response regulator